MASLGRMPLTSLSTANKSDLCSPEFYASRRCSFRSRKSRSDNIISSNGGILCKAVPIEPQTVIEGLNIAEDVSQVR